MSVDSVEISEFVLVGVDDSVVSGSHLSVSCSLDESSVASDSVSTGSDSSVIPSLSSEVSVISSVEGLVFWTLEASSDGSDSS